MFDSRAWKLFLALKRLRCVVNQREVFSEDFNIVKESTIGYLEKRLSFRDSLPFPAKDKFRLLPKHVWALSYGRLAQEMGSLANVNTQIGEQKNAMVKRHSQRACNTKNVFETITRRERETIALKSNSSKHQIPFEELSGIFFHEFNEEIQSLVLTHLPNHNHYNFLAKLKMTGFIFRADGKSCICTDFPRRPNMGAITVIAQNKVSKEIVFIVRELEQSLLNHLDILLIKHLDSYRVLSIHDLVFGQPVNIYHLKNIDNEDIMCCTNFFHN